MWMWGNKSESSGISDSAGMLSQFWTLSTDTTRTLVSALLFYALAAAVLSCLAVIVLHKANSSKFETLLALSWEFTKTDLSPLAAHCTSSLLSTLLLLSAWLNFWKSTNQHTSYTSDTSILYLPSACMHSFGQKSFSYAAPSAWNSLIRHTFPLKSHLFKLSHWLCMHMCRSFDCAFCTCAL